MRPRATSVLPSPASSATRKLKAGAFKPALITWLFRWLLFRFILQSGVVKLLSGDEHWRGLTALDYHFETQPLPTILAWYAHKLPELILQAGGVLTFVVELLVPFLILMPRRPRLLAALVICTFQLMIILTGSYNYFNFLTVCLCLLLLDDQLLRELWPNALVRRLPQTPSALPATAAISVAVAAVYLMLSTILFSASISRSSVSEGSRHRDGHLLADGRVRVLARSAGRLVRIGWRACGQIGAREGEQECHEVGDVLVRSGAGGNEVEHTLDGVQAAVVDEAEARG